MDDRGPPHTLLRVPSTLVHLRLRICPSPCQSAALRRTAPHTQLSPCSQDEGHVPKCFSVAFTDVRGRVGSQQGHPVTRGCSAALAACRRVQRNLRLLFSSPRGRTSDMGPRSGCRQGWFLRKLREGFGSLPLPTWRGHLHSMAQALGSVFKAGGVASSPLSLISAAAARCLLLSYKETDYMGLTPITPGHPPSRGPEPHHICKVPFPESGTVVTGARDQDVDVSEGSLLISLCVYVGLFGGKRLEVRRLKGDGRN